MTRSLKPSSLSFAALSVLCLTFGLPAPALAAPAEAQLLEIQVRLDEGNALLRDYFDARGAGRDEDARIASEKLAAARDQALDLLRKAYAFPTGKSLLDPPSTAVLASPSPPDPHAASLPGVRVEWRPRYDLIRFTRPSQLQEGEPAVTRPDGVTLLREKLFARPIPSLAAALLHEAVHFAALPGRSTACLAMRAADSALHFNPREAEADARDQEEVGAYQSQLAAAAALGLDSVEVLRLQHAKNQYQQSRARRRVERSGDASARAELESLRHEQSLVEKDLLAECDLRLSNPNLADKDKRRFESARRFAAGGAPASETLFQNEDAPTVDGVACGDEQLVETRPGPRRLMLNLMAGPSFDVYLLTEANGASIQLQDRFALAVELGVRVANNAYLLFQLQAPFNFKSVQLMIPVGFQYSAPIAIRNISLTFRGLVGYAATLNPAVGSVAHSAFVLVEAGATFQINPRFHVSFYPVSLPFFINPTTDANHGSVIDVLVSYRLMVVVGLDL